MKRICVLLTNDYEHDSRVKKECNSLSKKYKVDLFCLTKKEQKVINENKNWTVYKINVKFPLNKMFIYFFGVNPFIDNVVKANKSYDLIWANDFDTLKAGYLLKEKFSAKLVYDSHEYWRGMSGGDTLFLEIYKCIYCNLFLGHEKKYIKFADIVFTVNEYIAKLLKKDYNLPNVSVLYNVSYLNNSLVSKIKEVNSIVYVGKIGNHLEQIKLLLDVGVDVYHYGKPEDINFEHYHYSGYIPESKIVNQISKYGVGLLLYSAIRLDEKYSSPNKFFQYIQAGLPVLINNDSVFMSNFVNKYKIGLGFKNNNDLNNSYNLIIKNRDKYVSNIVNIKKAFCWENEEKKLLNMLVK